MKELLIRFARLLFDAEPPVAHFVWKFLATLNALVRQKWFWQLACPWLHVQLLIVCSLYLEPNIKIDCTLLAQSRLQDFVFYALLISNLGVQDLASWATQPPLACCRLLIWMARNFLLIEDWSELPNYWTFWNAYIYSPNASALCFCEWHSMTRQTHNSDALLCWHVSKCSNAFICVITQSIKPLLCTSRLDPS